MKILSILKKKNFFLNLNSNNFIKTFEIEQINFVIIWKKKFLKLIFLKLIQKAMK